MTNLRYNRGAQLERDIQHQLQAHHYLAIRAGGSHGPADILAAGHGHILLIQAKTNGRLGPLDRIQLLELADHLTNQGLPALALIGYRDRGIRYRILTGYGPREFTTWQPGHPPP